LETKRLHGAAAKSARMKAQRAYLEIVLEYLRAENAGGLLAPATRAGAAVIRSDRYHFSSFVEDWDRCEMLRRLKAGKRPEWAKFLANEVGIGHRLWAEFKALSPFKDGRIRIERLSGPELREETVAEEASPRPRRSELIDSVHFLDVGNDEAAGTRLRMVVVFPRR